MSITLAPLVLSGFLYAFCMPGLKSALRGFVVLWDAASSCGDAACGSVRDALSAGDSSDDEPADNEEG